MMKITKFGQSCLLIEEGDTRVLTDPGSLSSVPEDGTVQAIFITHKHQDHLDPELLKRIRAKNDCPVYTNSEVGEELQKLSIPFNLLEDGQTITVGSITVEGHGKLHAIIYKTIPQDRNVGYLFNDSLFHPGDSYTVPTKPVKVLALPVGGPWLKLSDAIDYATEVKPTRAFPMHDGMFIPETLGTYHSIPEKILSAAGIQFASLKAGESLEI